MESTWEEHNGKKCGAPQESTPTWIRLIKIAHIGHMNLSPCWSVREFWKSKLENSSSTNWIFSQQKSILKLIFAGYTGSKNPVRNRLKIQFIELDFSKLIFQKSSTNQQEEFVLTEGQFWEKTALHEILQTYSINTNSPTYTFWSWKLG